MVPLARALLVLSVLVGLSAVPRPILGAPSGDDGLSGTTEGSPGGGCDSGAGPSGEPVGLVSIGDVPASIVPEGTASIDPMRTASVGRHRLDQDGWETLEAISAHVRVPAGDSYEVRVSSARPGLTELLPGEPLTEAARQAVARAPTWLADPLADNFRRLGLEEQDQFAELILAADDPWVDEVAFQVARMAPESLTHSLFTPDLITDNARMIYEHDQVLQYVNVVDYGSAAEGGDYYSSTTYRLTDGETEYWVEIPRDVYYWYVVHPKLSDETAKKSSEPSTVQSTYGHFWREYLFSNPDGDHDYTAKDGETGYYPLLSDVLAAPTVLWDLQAVNLPKMRPFEEGDGALDVVGNWVGHVVPEKAKGNRPVQPNQIAYEHNGNCGELQDLLGAAARTGLIPVTLTSDHCEDHVWNEFFTLAPEPGWHPYQVSWEAGPTHIDNPDIAYDREHGGGKDVSAIWAFRPDGYIYDVVDRYSNACTFIAEVADAGGKPVDGARVLLASEAWGSDDQLTVANWCYTDSSGTCTFRLGDNQNYYMQVSSSIGSVPPEENRVQRVITASEPDRTYLSTVDLPGSLPAHEHQLDESEGDIHRLRVSFDVPNEIIYGQNLFGEAPEYAKWEGPGQIDVFLVDDDQYARFQAGEPFSAAVGEQDVSSGEIVFALPHLRTDWHLVMANTDKLVNTQVLDVEVELAWDAARGPRTQAYIPLARSPAVSGLQP